MNTKGKRLCTNMPNCGECPFNKETGIECRINRWVYGAEDSQAKRMAKKVITFIVVAVVMILMGSTPYGPQ